MTLAVTTPSSIASAAGCCVGVDVQATIDEPISTAATIVDKLAAALLAEPSRRLMCIAPHRSRSTRAVAAHFGVALRGLQIGVGALFAVSLLITAHRFALLGRHLVSSFGARNGDLELVRGCRLACLLRLIGDVLGIIIRLRLGHVVLRVGRALLGVRPRIRDVAICFGIRLGDVMLRVGG
ncbi:MAG: hypothetical protein ACREUC_22910 [Steroidobacteraceae bacterium]